MDADDPPTRIPLADEAATQRLGRVLESHLRAGDVVLLEGDIGAGKTCLARALIQEGLAVLEDVPSPTFTLVQTYEVRHGELWHCDLYRLTDPDELFELGLDSAMETAICLIEWPDRMGDARPKNALTLKLSTDGAGRSAELIGPEAWQTRCREIAAGMRAVDV
jgi:tRNA threonylcarbamoyladenosine biosynthesis protein TsaE